MYGHHSARPPILPKPGNEKADFLEQAKAAREERAQQHISDNAAVQIQVYYVWLVVHMFGCFLLLCICFNFSGIHQKIFSSM